MGICMKIATWNIERLKHKSCGAEILRLCTEVGADILVLTEADERVLPTYPHAVHSPTPPPTPLPPFPEPVRYAATEHRVSLYTKYPILRRHPTWDPHTSLCAELETPGGRLTVYGTIIGIHGNRRSSYRQELEAQLADWETLLAAGHTLCIAGDFNCSFGDNYYFTSRERDRLRQWFQNHDIRLLTEDQPMCIDHIAVSRTLAGDGSVGLEAWNEDKRLSDHQGIAVQWG